MLHNRCYIMRATVTVTFLLGIAMTVMAQEPSRPTCAVIPFINLTNQPASAYLASEIHQCLHAAMGRARVWQLVERARLRELLAEADLKSIGAAGGQPIRIADAQVLVVGEYRDEGGIVTVSARLVNASDAAVVRQANWTGHVSGIPGVMAPMLAAVLSGQEPPKPALTPAQQELFRKACKFMDQGKIDAAIDACTKILEQARKDVPTLLLRGYAELNKKGWTRYAVKDFEAVLEIDEDNVGAKIGLARTKLAGDQRQVEQALGLLQEVIKDNAEQGEALWLAATALATLGKTAEAISYTERAVVSLPEFAPAWLTLTELQLRGGTTSKAIVSAGKAVTFAPRDPGAWMLLGDAQMAAGDKLAAEKSFRKAMECDPPDELKAMLSARLKKFD